MHDYRAHKKIAFHARLLERSWDDIFDREDVDSASRYLQSTLRDLMNKYFPAKTGVFLRVIHHGWLRWPKLCWRKKRKLNPTVRMDAQLILKKELMRSLQKIVTRLRVERWALRPCEKRAKRDPIQALTRTLWESLMIILQIYATMKIIPDPYPWTSRKTLLHHSSHWARFTIRSAQNKANIYCPDYIPFWVWKENAAILAPAVQAIWNLSLSTLRCPSAWKQANVFSLPKVIEMLIERKASGNKQVFVHFKITNKRWIHAGRDKAIVLPKIMYALPVYGASQVDFNHHTVFFKQMQ